MQDSTNVINRFSNNEIIIISAVIVILGTLIVGLILYYLKRHHKKRDTMIVKEIEKTEATDRKFSETRKEFVAVFDEALKRLNSNEKIPGAILKEKGTMSSHKVAYDKFRPIFKRIKGAVATECLDRAWKEYYDTEKYGDSPFAAFDIQKFGGDKRKATKATIDKIENMLKAAKIDL